MMLRQVLNYLLILIVCTIWSCNRGNEDKSREYHQPFLASSIRLQPNQTEIILSDYLPKGYFIDSIVTAQGLQWVIEDDSLIVTLSAEASLEQLSNMSIWSRDIKTDVLVIDSEKKKFIYQFEPGIEKYKSVQMVGDINAWNPRNTILEKIGNIFQTTLYLHPGEYGYQIVLDGKWQLDPGNQDRISNNHGGFNSRIFIDGPNRSLLPFIWYSSFDKNIIQIGYRNAMVGVYSYYNNMLIPSTVNQNNIFISIPPESKMQKRSFFRIRGFNREGLSNDMMIPLEYGRPIEDTDQLTRGDFHAATMYFLMVDRFRNGDPENDIPEIDSAMRPEANFFGGDLAGVYNIASQGYFDSLGINTIWLSPIVQNPSGTFGLFDKGGIKSTFSAYHGYWPISFTEVDTRFGNSKMLKKLVDEIHMRNKNILLDFVSNHVHEQHPVYQAHKKEDWATNLYLPDGTLNTEQWDEHRLTTWFDIFLPTLNLEKEEVAQMLSDSAVYWLETYDVDGFRHDATKHIPESFWRMLTEKIHTLTESTNKNYIQIGETYGTAELISSYINSGMLDAQFDFNIYDAIIDMLVNPNIGTTRLYNRLMQSMQFYGCHHLMGNMTGNQDKPRLMSIVNGDISLSEDTKLAGWSRDIQKQGGHGFNMVEILHAINAIIPGIPCIYYGDELGFPGGNDPDNRRMMQFDGHTIEARSLKEKVAKLMKLRCSQLALIYGITEIDQPTDHQLIIIRSYRGQTVYFVLNMNSVKAFFELKLPEYASTGIVESINNNEVKMEDSIIHLALNPYSYDILYP